MAKVIGKAPPPRGTKRKEKKNQLLRERAFKQIAREYPHLVETEEKRKQLLETIKNTELAIDSNGQLKMFYNGEEK